MEVKKKLYIHTYLEKISHFENVQTFAVSLQRDCSNIQCSWCEKINYFNISSLSKTVVCIINGLNFIKYCRFILWKIILFNFFFRTSLWTSLPKLSVCFSCSPKQHFRFLFLFRGLSAISWCRWRYLLGSGEGIPLQLLLRQSNWT